MIGQFCLFLLFVNLTYDIATYKDWKTFLSGWFDAIVFAVVFIIYFVIMFVVAFHNMFLFYLFSTIFIVGSQLIAIILEHKSTGKHILDLASEYFMILFCISSIALLLFDPSWSSVNFILSSVGFLIFSLLLIGIVSKFFKKLRK